MLTKRVIPCLDVHNGRVVKGVNFVNLTDAGDPVLCAMAYNQAGADELCFLDITASCEERNIMEDIVQKTAECVFIPLTVGGGIRSVEDFRRILSRGADKISINSSAIKNPNLITEAALKFGSQCVVVAIDAKMAENGRYSVFLNGGRVNAGLDLLEWAERVQALGAGEILLTSMDTDGTKNGYDITMLKSVCDIVNIPVIASGGAGALEHFSQCIQQSGADAVLCASLFHFGELTIHQVKEHMFLNDIPVRRTME